MNTRTICELFYFAEGEDFLRRQVKSQKINKNLL